MTWAYQAFTLEKIVKKNFFGKFLRHKKSNRGVALDVSKETKIYLFNTLNLFAIDFTTLFSKVKFATSRTTF